MLHFDFGSTIQLLNLELCFLSGGFTQFCVRGTQCAECCRLAVLRLEAAFLVKLVGFILGFFPAAG